MKTVLTFIAGTMFLSSVFATDPGFEERYKMKNGRYTPDEEARIEASRKALKEGRTTRVIICKKHGCCVREQRAAIGKSEISLGDPGFQERYKMKNGRYTPAEEARIAAAKKATTGPVLLASARICEGDCCTHRAPHETTSRRIGLPWALLWTKLQEMWNYQSI